MFHSHLQVSFSTATGDQTMFGINDLQIVLGYGLALGFTLACIVYGLAYRNAGDNRDS